MPMMASTSMMVAATAKTLASQNCVLMAALFLVHHKNPNPLIHAFHHYLLPIITAYNSSFPEFPIDTSKQFVTSTILNGLQRKIDSTHQTEAMMLAIQDAKPTQAAAFLLLFSPLASMLMHSLPQCFSNSRLSNDHYTILFQQKLRIPCLCRYPANLPLLHKPV
jgi:hypothetical protein